ncbi:pyridoxal phosphate-dependent aminotransferase [Aminobacterium mobile]|jgi:histidinol-phosphate aminotransferase|uniref:pyridoxal phosphate-dependent aminotransferase n=1 Tax=Aminobacterium mobile TaxID=81467 RepID=UPI000463FE67|nr:histidinol-phosphate transaminase [Aminobacterium mobile]
MFRIEDMVRLDKNENPFLLPSSIKENVLSALREVEWNRYPDSGYKDIKDALSSLLHFPNKFFVLGNGGDEVLCLLFTAYVQPGATVLTFSPSFSEYAHLCKVFHARHITIPIDMADGLCSFNENLFFDTMQREKPSLVLIDSPNNPTGKQMPLQFIQKVVYENSAITVIDEAYGEFAPSTYLETLREQDFPKRMVALKTLSKAWGLAGIRFGYGVCHPDVTHKLNSIKSPFNINVLTAETVKILLREPHLLIEKTRQICNLRDSFIKKCQLIPRIQAYPSNSNFVFIHVPEEERQIKKTFKEAGIAVKFFCISGKSGSWIRVSVGVETDLNRVLHCLSQIVLTRR